MGFLFGTGDNGKSQLFGSSQRTSKSACNFEALGDLDELMSSLGVCRASAENLKEDDIVKWVRIIQEKLFIIQVEIATGDPSKKTKILQPQAVKELERIINYVENDVGEIKSFIIPGNDILASFLDYSRALARRTERRVILLKESGKRDVSQSALAYLNRLSSCLFMLARFVQKKHNIPEEHPKYE
ncbi:cob(I)yrinic acid a,c-diamide adenosyltransferase [Patescibacteria group bacterium]